MDFTPFISKKNKETEGGEKNKKIEFSQKLSQEDTKNLPKASSLHSKKSNSFDFLKKVEEQESALPKMQEEILKKKESLPDVGIKKNGLKPVNGKSSNGKFPPSKKKFFGFLKKNKIKKEKIIRADILDVNLVRGEIIKFFDWQKNVLILIVCVFSSLTIISFVYWGISWWGSKIEYTRDPFAVQNYYRLNREIKNLNDEIEEISNFKQKMDIVDTLLDKHIYWTSFFDFLEENTLSNVYFSDFSGDIDGKYRLSAITNDFDAIDAQIKKLTSNKYISNARVDSGAILGVGGGESVKVSFNLNLTLNPTIFVE